MVKASVHSFRILIPTVQEVWGYMTVSFALLALGNIGAIVTWLSGGASSSDGAAEFLRAQVGHLTDGVDGQLVVAVVWGMTALLALLLTLGLSSYVKNAASDVNSLIYFERTHNTQAERFVGTRLTLRICGIVSLAILGVLLIHILPGLLDSFRAGLLHLFESWRNIPIALGATLALATILWLGAVLCRLTVLRVRVFSDVIG